MSPLNYFNYFFKKETDNYSQTKNRTEEVGNDDGITPYSPQTRKELSSDDYEDPKQVIKRLKHKKDEFKLEYNLLKKELREVKGNNEELIKLRRKLDSNLSKEKASKEQLEQNHTKAKKEFDSKLKSLESEVKFYKQRYEELAFKNRNMEQAFVNEKKQLEQNQTKAKKEFDSKLKSLENEVKSYKQRNEGLALQKRNVEQEFDREKRIMEQEFVREKENYERNIDNLELNIKKQKKIFDQALQQSQERYSKNLNNIQKKLNDKGNGLRELEEENAKLREEASKYQSALGVATNTRLGDDDQNHSVKFKQDILNLQKSLENYVTHLKPNMDIDIEKVNNLAKEYGCFNEITEADKLFIKAILQRKILDQVQDYSFRLSEYQGSNVALELNIDIKTRELLELIDNLSKTRVGTDKVIDAAAIKIRQEVYGILGNRGFNDIIDLDDDGTSKTFTHDLINYASHELNKMMNQYRKINDNDRKNKIEAMAPKLIQDIYQLFCFRLHVQEPIAEPLLFAKNTKIDPNKMNGNWDDDDINQLRVGICYFPLIGRDLTSSNIKVYTTAKVFSRAAISSNESDEDVS
ncbi:17861_t:CDS:1 [Funneliformis caledonium]|uniref:17861_t:CDS:1 n=1 Tax=Funneliformis caledonium TaxID=1117310 RepID=A0A9N9A778_9GLOM|nr:17861_t:CDS:1 [Funneliformis caledonium]